MTNEDTHAIVKQYWRTASKEYYEKNSITITLKLAVRYYRRKKEQGLEWKPRKCSKLYVWCLQHNLDPIKVIEGTQDINTVLAQTKEY